jgi:hypothetical protein
VAGAIFAISATSRPDLSDLVPIRNSAENYFILNWPALLRDHPHALIAGSSLFFGAPVQALGYMVEGDHAIVEGEWVLDFVLLPDSGNLLHPAHHGASRTRCPRPIFGEGPGLGARNISSL